jgi:predicted DNA-binding protein with PD1-like motif
MKAKVLSEASERTYALVFEPGDEVIDQLTNFAEQHELTASHFTAIGAFSDVMLGYFDCEQKNYSPIPVNEQVEVLSLIGDVALKDGKPKIHAHVVVGLADGRTRGGHLLQAHVRPTLEVMLSESPNYLQRRHDEASGLALISI